MNKTFKYIVMIIICVFSGFLFLNDVKAIKTEYDFDYTGDYQEFVVPVTGTYKLQVWGASSGGSHQDSYQGDAGKGGYSTGVVKLYKGDVLYIYVGGEGVSCNGKGGLCTSPGGYNGGGDGWKRSTRNYGDPMASGGGATDIRLVNGAWNDSASLLSRFIVAGGGGAGGTDKEPGGHGGGLTGIQVDSTTGKGGTQTTGWAFGYGFSAIPETLSYINSTYGGNGAGGGWYGGYSAAGSNKWEGAGGGSGFVWTSENAGIVPDGYSVSNIYYLNDAVTIDGGSEMPTHDGTSTMQGNLGNGYAKLQLLDYVPITSSNLELNKISDSTFEVEIPNDNFVTNFSHGFHDIIFSQGVGEQTLNIGTTHDIILMNSLGEIQIFNIIVSSSIARLDSVEFEGVDFIFNSFEYNYNLEVESNIKTLVPNIVTSNGVTYAINNTSLKAGINKVIITASKDGYKSSEYIFVINRKPTNDLEAITKEFNYTGNYQEFTAPYTGRYKLEVWGASGGGSHQNSYLGVAGKGGYSTGMVYLNEGEKLYVYVGGEGTPCDGGGGICTVPGGYNGGGDGWKKSTNNIADPMASGGGATDIRLIPGDWNNNSSLLSRLIVAGGGGAGGTDGEKNEPGGHGGGLSAVQPNSKTGNSGTQTAGWAFGYGFSASSETNSYISDRYGGVGAGGGWYGGYATNGDNGYAGAGGGSGFIWTSESAANVPAGYSVTSEYYLRNAETTPGDSNIPTHDGTTTMVGNMGNGYAKITYYDNEQLDEITSLTVDKGVLSPEFKPTIYDYTVLLNEEETELTIDATTKLGEGVIIGTGTFTIPAGTTVKNVTFTDNTGYVTVYNVEITRVANPSSLIGGFKINGILYPDFDVNKFDYEIEMPTETIKINVELLKLYPSQTIKGDTIYDFTESTLTKTIIMESEGSLSNQPYTFTFNRKKSTNLKNLNITGGVLTTDFDPYKYEYTLDLLNSQREVEFDAEAWFPEAVITVTEPRYVGIDDKKITLKVELEGVSPTTYTFNINRIPDNFEKIENGYQYTGDYQTFIAPFSGSYKLEVWGASGSGYHQNNYLGKAGLGGYTSGIVNLMKGDTLYIYVGGEGTACNGNGGTCVAPGGYNGGGSGWKRSSNNFVDPMGSGGGATDMRFVSGTWNDEASLLSRLIVAGGGGAGGTDGEKDEPGGHGGGLSAVQPNSKTGNSGTQTSGWGFGYGFSAQASTLSYISNPYGGVGAGGGWYGGYATNGDSGYAGAGGGSGFIWSKNSSNYVPTGYSVNAKYYLREAETIAGNEYLPTHDGNNLMQGNLGNGYAKITSISGMTGDTFLDSLVINDGNVEINFEPWTLEYSIVLDKDATNLKVDATPKDAKATVFGLGTFDVAPGSSKHEVIVTTSDGNSKTYVINIEKEPSDEARPIDIVIKNPQSYLCSASKTFCNYSFDQDINTYNISYPFVTNELTFEAKLRTKYQTVKYQVVKDTGTEELTNGKITLEPGLNVVEVIVTSESGDFSETYTYNLNKDDSGNNNLASLTIKDPSVELDFDSYIYEYTFSIPSTYDSIDIEAIPQNTESSVVINDNENLKQGMNKISIVVTAPNGNSKTYILNVFKEKSDNTLLDSLVVKDDSGTALELTPIFNRTILDYTVNVPSTTTSITIEAEAEGSVTGTGTFNLNSGKNTFEVIVTSESGLIDTYIVNVIKAKNNNSDLLNIEMPGYTLSPEFTSDNKSYSVEIPGDVSSLQVNVTPKMSTTTYVIKGNNNLTSNSKITVTSIAEDKSYQVYEINVIKEKSSNNYLDKLNVIGATLNEEFDKEDLSYTIDVDGSVNSITIEGISEASTAKVTGNGVYAINKGENTINLVVTSEDGNERTYTIKVNKALNNDITLKSITNNQGSKVTKIEDTTLGYDYLINVQYEVNQIEITGIANASTSTVQGNGKYTLNTKDNDIILRVIAENNDYKDYVIRVVRDQSDNDDLDFLYVHEGGLDPSFSETIILYDVKVPNDTNTLHIEAVTEDKNASYEVIGGVKLDNGIYTYDISGFNVNTPQFVEVVVTAENGVNKKVYTLSVTKQEATTETLALLDLTIKKGEQTLDLTPNPFNPDILNYTLEVPNDVSEIEVAATALGDNVRIEGLGTKQLKVGKNGISVFVIGESGVQRDYQVVITRAKSSDARLNSLAIKGSTLSPHFFKDTYSYTLGTSASSLEFTTINPIEAEATYEILGNENFASGENIVTIRVTAPDGKTTKDYTLTVTKEGSKNNNLASLEVVGYTLTPTFHKGVTFYTLEVPNNINSVLINGTAEDNAATINGLGVKGVQTGENYFDIEVESEVGTKKTYRILITKDASDNNYLASLNVSEGTLNPIFDKEKLDYEVNVSYDISSIEINGTLEDINASTTSFKTYDLVEGENNILITVTSESGKIRNYNIKVNRDTINSAYLTSLEVKNQELDNEFNKELFEYYITVDNEITSLELSYTPEDKNATVVVTGNESFNIGMNEIHINVTSSDGSKTEDYIIYVNRLMSSNNYLSVLTSNIGTLDPIFNPEIYEYTISVDRDTNQIELTAVTEDKSAIIITDTCKTDNNCTNTLTETFDLKTRETTIELKVKSSMGISRTYKVKVVKFASNDNLLKNLSVMNKEIIIPLNPEFKEDIDTYNMIVDNDINFIQIKAEAKDEYAVVSGIGTKNLITGLNTYDIIVTAEDGSINTYTINITKEISNNNYLSSLIPSVGTLSPEFDKDIDAYTINLAAEETEISFNAIPESNLAKVTGAELKNVSDGVSVRNIVVTAENGDERTYTITINKETAAEAKLDILEIENYPFDFDPDTFTYNVQVSNSKKILLESEIMAIPKDSKATINMMGNLHLTDGIVNIYVVEVIARDGYTTQQYTLNITRDSEEYTLRSNKYEIVRFEDESNEDYVIGIQPSTIISDFKNNFENDPLDLKVYLDTTKVLDTDLTATALILKLEKNNHVYDTLRVIVRGDLTKDGKVNITDQVKMINYVGRTTTFDKYQMLAGDLTFDGKVNITDQVKIINYVGRTISDLNNKPTS